MKKIKIGIVGCGAIGEGVSLFIDRELKDKAVLRALCDREVERAQDLREKISDEAEILDIDSLIRNVDLVIETASQEAAKYVLDKALDLKKDVIILSVGALIENQAAIRKAHTLGIKIYVPSGAICAVDGVGALSLGKIKQISLTTSKPPRGFLGIQYLKRKKIAVENLKKERVVFQGNVKEAIKYFPQNINVAATLFLAASYGSCEAKDVKVCIKADPNVKANIHRIEIEAEEAKVSITIENAPSRVNPKTSTLAILSTKYLLKKIFSSFKVGS